MYLLDLVALYITPQQTSVAFGYIRLGASGCGSVAGGIRCGSVVCSVDCGDPGPALGGHPYA